MADFGERIVPGLDHAFTGRLLHSERSDLQLIEVYEHEHFGRVLVLDGFVQTTVADEYRYHEMLVHPTLCALEQVRRVLIIGGGDGGTLRHVLAHDPEEVVMCEIDRAVVDVSRKHLPEVSAGALDDPRATLVYEDGAAYVGRRHDLFDAIVVDSTDPVGAAQILFSTPFYASCLKALRPGGILVAQSGSAYVQRRELQMAVRNMAAVMPLVEVHLGAVLHYPGVLWTFTTGTTGDPVSTCGAVEVAARLEERSIAPRFYTPELHAAAFALPKEIRDLVDDALAASASLPRG